MVATVLKVLNQDQFVFELSKPITYSYWVTDENGIGEDTTRSAYYVISSRTKAFEVPETYLFEADSNGEFMHMSELPGSIKGCFDIFVPLIDLGYEIVVPPSVKILFTDVK
jgi:hypothetical protein